MAEKIAEYFGQLKFKVDDDGLKKFISQLNAAAKAMKLLTHGTAGNSMHTVTSGFAKIAAEAKIAAQAVDQATAKMGRSQDKLARKMQTSSGSLVGQKISSLKSRGALADFQTRTQLIAMRDFAERRATALQEREVARAQRRAAAGSKEEERRFQNRVSRTYSPTTSKLMRQQADLAKVQERYNTALSAGNKLEAERYKHAMKYLRLNIRDLNRERREQNLGWFGKTGRAFGYGRGMKGGLALLQPSLGMVAAGGAAGAGYFLTDAFRQTMDIQSYKQQFQALYGTEASGKAGLQSYLDYSNKMGTNASKNMQEYLRFMFASKDTVGLETGRGIYESFSVLAKTRGVKGDAYSRSLTSLSQMLS